DTYQTILNGFQFLTLATLATHMHLHLWQTNRPAHGSSAPLSVPISSRLALVVGGRICEGVNVGAYAIMGSANKLQKLPQIRTPKNDERTRTLDKLGQYNECGMWCVSESIFALHLDQTYFDQRQNNMEYSAEDIAAARSLQFTAIYDYACSLHEEWAFLLRSRWCKMKSLYIVTRYLPFILLATNLYLCFASNENIDEFQVVSTVRSGLGIVIVIVSECFFILRTYVLWDRNRILLAAMLSTFLTFIIVSFGVTFANCIPAAYVTSAIPGITGYYLISAGFLYFIPLVLLFVFELGLVILTLIHAMQKWQENQSRRYLVLLNHNISYYACGLLFSIGNIFTLLLLQYSYHIGLFHFQFIMHAFLATHMHLHLWQASQHPHGSTDAVMHISMSDISFANIAT
ncbi:uncharacterized protein EDB93DRAFT_1106067, partial [Suillus bovinus]|uniref:uncharacterized protein n=1 Tax=Suillus bovinus TaxID=48563 RepID=UPI001B86848F